jgi:hypothetical protein
MESASDWISTAAPITSVCALPCIILPSFRELGELVVIVLGTSCLLKAFHEGPHCALVEVKNAAFLL